LQGHQLTPAASKREKEGAKGKKGQTKKKRKKRTNKKENEKSKKYGDLAHKTRIEIIPETWQTQFRI